MFVSRKPREELAEVVELLWLAQGATTEAAMEWVLPHGRGQLLMNLADDQLRWHRDWQDCVVLGGVALAGPFTRPLLVDTRDQARVCGVSFTAAGIARFAPAAAVANQLVSLADLGAIGCSSLLRALDSARETEDSRALLDIIEVGLLRSLGDPPEQARSVRAAASSLAATTAGFAAIAGHLGRSQRRLSVEFRELVGISPKRYQRLQRFRRALTAISSSQGFAETAIALGYADQAHFNHEFREFATMTPTEYLAGKTGYVGHVRAG